MRSVAATPTSAEIRASSSASIVSTSTGRLRPSGSSARETASSNRSQKLLRGASQGLFDLVEETHGKIVASVGGSMNAARLRFAKTARRTAGARGGGHSGVVRSLMLMLGSSRWRRPMRISTASVGDRRPVEHGRHLAKRSAARSRDARRARARRRWCARLRRPSACPRARRPACGPAPKLDPDVAIPAQIAGARQHEIAQAAQARQASRDGRLRRSPIAKSRRVRG